MKHKKEKQFYIAIFCFIVGFCLLLYPTVSNFINERHSSHVISNYEKTVKDMSKTDYSIEFAEAKKHNEFLAQQGFLAAGVDMENRDELNSYNRLLNVTDDGVMGDIQIPKIQVNLPIYHTTEESVLQSAVGHYVGSSLPVGGKSTHAVLSGHRGLPSAELFTELDKLEKGDVFYIEVLNKKLAYQVDKIKTIDPEKAGSNLDIVKGKDYVTLMTCTPYGVNTDRLLVRGKRIPYKKAEEKKEIQKGKKIAHLAFLRRFFMFIVSFAVIMFLAVRLGLFLGDNKNRYVSGKNK